MGRVQDCGVERFYYATGILREARTISRAVRWSLLPLRSCVWKTYLKPPSRLMAAMSDGTAFAPLPFPSIAMEPFSTSKPGPKRLCSAEGFWPLDVRQYVEAERVAGTILEEHGRADLLVNSVGVSVRSRSWDSVSKQHLKEHLNVKAVWIKTA
jgi:hypothetical protein